MVSSEKTETSLNRIASLSRQSLSVHASPVMVRIVFRFLAIGLGMLHAYAAIQSQSMNADGIAYLDIGDAYFRGDWANAINSVWSPLYSWILGLVNFLIQPSMQSVFAIVHIVNFLLYLFALLSFEFMWQNVRNENSQPDSLTLSDSLWWALGYLLFIWMSLNLIQIWAVTPDMLMAGFVFLSAGLIGRIRSGDESRRLFLSLGLILGLGYLSKTFMFSVAMVFVGLAWLVQKRSGKSLSRMGLTTLVFLMISLPYLLLISEKEGRLTIGEAGTITYVRYVNGIPFPHWQGDPASGIGPVHPSRIIHESPTIYEFGEPIGGTYPISMDPSYWYKGIEPHFDLGGLLTRLLSSSLVYAELFFQKQGTLVACVLALYLMGRKSTCSSFDILQRWALVIPAVVALGLYATVLVQGRYVGVFILLFWADVLANVRLTDGENEKFWLKSLGVIASLGLLVNIALFNLDGVTRLNPSLGAGSTDQELSPARPLAVAQALVDLGIQPGDRVGVIGYAYDSFWARLARVKIVAEMLEVDAEDFWRGDERIQQSVLQAFAKAGAKAVIAEYVPSDVELRNWKQIGNTSYYIFRIRE